jgi:hypothetical protein
MDCNFFIYKFITIYLKTGECIMWANDYLNWVKVYADKFTYKSNETIVYQNDTWQIQKQIFQKDIIEILLQYNLDLIEIDSIHYKNILHQNSM